MSRAAGERADIAVLGGGLVGRLIAWRLAGLGMRVALYERGDAAGTALPPGWPPRCSRRWPRRPAPSC